MSKKLRYLSFGALVLLLIFGTFVLFFKSSQENISLSHTNIIIDASGERFVTGSLKNNLDRQVTNVEVTILLLDKDSKEIEERMAWAGFIPPKKTWDFKVEISSPEVVYYKIASINAEEGVETN